MGNIIELASMIPRSSTIFELLLDSHVWSKQSLESDLLESTYMQANRQTCTDNMHSVSSICSFYADHDHCWKQCLLIKKFSTYVFPCLSTKGLHRSINRRLTIWTLSPLSDLWMVLFRVDFSRRPPNLGERIKACQSC